MRRSRGARGVRRRRFHCQELTGDIAGLVHENEGKEEREEWKEGRRRTSSFFSGRKERSKEKPFGRKKSMSSRREANKRGFSRDLSLEQGVWGIAAPSVLLPGILFMNIPREGTGGIYFYEWLRDAESPVIARPSRHMLAHGPAPKQSSPQSRAIPRRPSTSVDHPRPV